LRLFFGFRSTVFGIIVVFGSSAGRFYFSSDLELAYLFTASLYLIAYLGYLSFIVAYNYILMAAVVVLREIDNLRQKFREVVSELKLLPITDASDSRYDTRLIYNNVLAEGIVFNTNLTTNNLNNCSHLTLHAYHAVLLFN